VSRELWFVVKELIARYGWKHLEPDLLTQEHLREKVLKEFGQIPECVLFWEEYDLVIKRVKQIHDLKCKRFFFADDLHWWTSRMRLERIMVFTFCDAILCTYADAFRELYPELWNKRVLWVPHSASPDFMVGFNSTPENAILLSGAVGEYYPLRQDMKRLSKEGDLPIVYHPHPGYHCGYDYATDDRVGTSYARTINRYRSGFTDCLIFKYVVAKYFEIPATGSLLVAENAVSESLSAMGFIDGENYIGVSADNLTETIRYVLDERNHAEVDRMREKGQSLVWERHKTSDRARLIDLHCT
jgi:hypothetical protein